MSTPRFLADEDLRYAIVAALRRVEPSIDFLRVVDAGLAAKPDSEILDFATSVQRLLVSHDVTTLQLTAEQRIADGSGISGLLLVPQSQPTRVVVESLLLIWSASETEEWADRIVFLPF